MARMIVVGCGTPDRTLDKAIFFLSDDTTELELQDLVRISTNIPEPTIQGEYNVPDDVLNTVYENVAYEG